MKKLNSLMSKIIGITIIGILLTCIVNLVTMIPTERKNTDTEVNNLLLSMGETEGKMIESESKSKDFSFNKIYDDLDDVKVRGYKTGYTYVVDSNGIMMYHPTKDKIGEPVENEQIKKVVKNLNDGKDVTEDVVTYNFKGVMKYSSYYVTKDSKYIVVLTIDKDEAFESLTKIYKTLVIETIASLIVFGIMAYFIARGITRPISMLNNSIKKLSNLDFVKENNKLSDRKDEVGIMSREIDKLITALSGVVNGINDVSINLNDNANKLLSSAYSINQNLSNNAATSQELAASMEETSASIGEIDNNVNEVEVNTKEIFDMTEKGSALSSSIMEKAERLKENTVDTNNKTKEIYLNISKESKDSMEKAKAVSKIQELADSIKNIAEQTSLLSLNASIEAARAGDAGKGFVVVAGEIGNLATMSTETVNNITEVVDEVQVAVDNMSSCFEKTLKFLEENVLKDYEVFLDVGNQYSDDAKNFKGSMDNINNSISLLNNTIKEISASVIAITSTIEECANGVTDIAEKTTEISGETDKTNEMVEYSVESSKSLGEIVNKFKI